LDDVDERRTEALARQRISEQRETDRDDMIVDNPMVETNGPDQMNNKSERTNGVAHEEEESANGTRHIEPEGARDLAEDNDEMDVEAGEDAVIY